MYSYASAWLLDGLSCTRGYVQAAPRSALARWHQSQRVEGMDKGRGRRRFDHETAVYRGEPVLDAARHRESNRTM